MDNKKKISCLNCQHSYRDGEGILKCFKGRMTSVTQSYDCNGYQVFIENKEDLIDALSREIHKVKYEDDASNKPKE